MTLLQRTTHAAIILGVFALFGCGGTVVIEGASSGSSSGSFSSSSGGSVSDDWTTLVDGTWQLTPGTEGYWCTRKTLEDDVYITAFRAEAPPGTHHTLLLWKDGGGPDGEEACGPLLGSNMVHASGINTDDLVMPEGVAVKIPAGTQLLLNLHLFNSNSSTLNGVSGVLVKTVSAAEVKYEAEMILTGPTNVNVPPNGTQTIEDACVFPETSTIFTLWPHMHQYGTNMKITYDGAAGSKVLHDGAFSFGEQVNYAIEPLTVAAGEQLRVECTYKNPTSDTIHWGDSSKAEMCFAGVYRYPKLGKACF